MFTRTNNIYTRDTSHFICFCYFETKVDTLSGLALVALSRPAQALLDNFRKKLLIDPMTHYNLLNNSPRPTCMMPDMYWQSVMHCSPSTPNLLGRAIGSDGAQYLRSCFGTLVLYTTPADTHTIRYMSNLRLSAKNDTRMRISSYSHPSAVCMWRRRAT